MKKNYLNITKTFAGTVLGLFLGTSAAQAQAPVTLTFTYTGAAQQFTIPSCVGSMTIDARGAGGITGSAGNAGGTGGRVLAVMTATPGSVLSFYVGGQGSVTAGGFNGGGNGGVSSSASGGGGGGASDVRFNGTVLANRILIAGGGGGGGGSTIFPLAVGGAGGGGSSCSLASGIGYGGSGGGGYVAASNGIAGACSGGSTTAYASGGGGGGLSSAGGGGGQPSVVGGAGGMGCNGALGVGGDGGGTSFICGGVTGGTYGAGGGGGGFYGGGGGMTGTGGGHGGGGGGSSYADNTLFAGPTFTGGGQSGNGIITITYAFNGAGVTVSSPSPAICSGNSTSLIAASVNSYTWAPVGTFTGSTNTTVVVSPTTTTTYSVSGTNSQGCISNAAITVTVNSVAPTLTVASTAPTVCLNNTVTISATGALTYTISNGVTNNITFTPSATNAYTVTGKNGCGTSTAAITITVSSLPVTINTSSTIVCAGLPATLTAGGATNYTWTASTSNTSGATPYIVFPAVNTTYTLFGTTGVCAGIATLAIATKANPTLSITPSSATICVGNSVTLVAAGTSTSYAWSTGQTGPTISSAPATLTVFTVIGTNTNNCNSSASQVIYVNPNPTITAMASNAVVCSGGPSVLSVSGANNYTWSTSATGSSVTVNPTSSTVYTVVGSFTTGCNTSTTISVSLFVPTISVTGNTAVCTGSHVTIGATGAGSYTWANNAGTGANISVAPLANTVYTVTGAVNDPISGVTCNASNTLAVTVNANPTLTATSNRTNNAICIGESVVLTASGAGANGTYTWTGGSGATVASSITATPIADQAYAVAGKDENGCRSFAAIQVAVFPCTGIKANSADAASLLIYPNPSNGEFTISSSQEITLHIVNQLGQQVKTITLNGSASTVSDLSNGIYFITGKNSNGSVTQKIVVAK